MKTSHNFSDENNQSVRIYATIATFYYWTFQRLYSLALVIFTSLPVGAPPYGLNGNSNTVNGERSHNVGIMYIVAQRGENMYIYI